MINTLILLCPDSLRTARHKGYGLYFQGIIAYATLLLMLACATNAGAQNTQEKTTDQQPAQIHYCPVSTASDNLKPLSWIDKTHAKASRKLCQQVNRIDGFFGIINPSKTAKGFLRLRTDFEWQNTDETTLELEPNIKVRVRLPNISRKLHLLIINDQTEEQTMPSTKSLAPHEQDTHTSLLGELLGIPGSEPVDYDFDIGSKSDDGPKLFTRARATFQFWLKDNSNLRLSQSIFWLDGLGFGEESRLEYNQALNQTSLFRWITSAEFNEETQGLGINQQLTFFHQLNQKTGISYSIRAEGDTRPTLKITEYGFDILFRKNILKPWFFYEIEPSLFWPIEFQREMSLRLILRFEVQLGDQI